MAYLTMATLAMDNLVDNHFVGKSFAAQSSLEQLVLPQTTLDPQKSVHMQELKIKQASQEQTPFFLGSRVRRPF